MLSPLRFLGARGRKLSSKPSKDRRVRGHRACFESLETRRLLASAVSLAPSDSHPSSYVASNDPPRLDSAVILPAMPANTRLATTSTIVAEPAGGPFKGQSDVWGGYSDAAERADAFGGSSYVMPGVPAYLWHDGCGPTAAGMVLGYWDMHGYPNLIPGDSSYETASVDQAIASREHDNDYALPLDDETTGVLADKSSLGGAHANNSIADWMRTSWSAVGNCYGWSWLADIDPAITGYATAAGYSGFVASTKYWSDFSLADLKQEINAGHPMGCLVDSDADGLTDHFVTVVGYDDVLMRYACLNTWDTSVHWYDFKPMAAGQPFGIRAATFISPPAAPPYGTETVQFTTASQSVSEGSTMMIVAQLSAISNQDVTVPFTVSGSATMPGDYTITASPLVIPAGSTTGILTISAKDDGVNELNEMVVVTLGTPTNAAVSGINVHTATIFDVSPPPMVTLPGGKGTNSVVISRSGNDLLVVNNKKQTLFNQPLGSFRVLLLYGADNKTDTVTIDFSVGGRFSIPQGIAFDGGRGQDRRYADASRHVGQRRPRGGRMDRGAQRPRRSIYQRGAIDPGRRGGR